MNNLTFRQLANMKLHIFLKLALLSIFLFFFNQDSVSGVANAKSLASV